jgi:arabinan endo-1,5-alpha-L-arabinosidase
VDVLETMFEVSGLDAQGQPKSGSYILEDSNPGAYYRMFDELAADFNLYVPSRRIMTESRRADELNFDVLLRENMAPDMVYGYADPSLTQVFDVSGYKSSYFLLVSSHSAADSFPILFSKDLSSWTFRRFVFPKGKQPNWALNLGAEREFRCPVMQLIGVEFRLYFVARDKLTRQLCIGMARSLFPDGPFVADQEPILKQNAVNPHIFVYDPETVYLFWKEDNNSIWPPLLARLLYNHFDFIDLLFEDPQVRNTAVLTTTLWPWVQTLEPSAHSRVLQRLVDCVSSNFNAFCQKLVKLAAGRPEALQEEINRIVSYLKTPIYGQQLSADGASLIRERIKVIENDLEWEAHVVESAWITRHEDSYFLFYSGNDGSNDQYGIGLAIAQAPLGPYVKNRRPIIAGSDTSWRPGHPCVVADPGGSYRLILHGYDSEQSGYKEFQVLLSVPLRFSDRKVKLG